MTGLGAAAAAEVVAASGLDPLHRPEDVTPAGFAALYAAVKARLPNDPGSSTRS
ncbi:MAG: hypothetical protein H7066_19040 [Cytophagaceae bacterium]|nr:hypothetical protein [Gemmatimonadaceae bacterium]